jgi:hypothetical protein
MRLSAHVYQVRWDSRRARVLVPARPLTGTAVISPLSAKMAYWSAPGPIWKAVRSQLRHSRPAVLQAPQARPQKPYRHWEWSKQRLIRMTEHAATLVVAAPAWSLLDLGDTVTDAGEQVASSRDIHRHGQAHLIGLTSVLSGGGSNPHEFDIVGSDRLFHKRERTRRNSERTG